MLLKPKIKYDPFEIHKLKSTIVNTIEYGFK